MKTPILFDIKVNKPELFTKPKNLLSKGATNAKTAKNTLETYILYLAPARQNSKGINLCPKASGCIKACLYTAGRGKFSNVQKARINKANYFVYDKPGFIQQLKSELIKINNKAEKTGSKVAIRLNGTSDIDFIYLLMKYGQINPFELKNLIYYDYTKIPGKVKKYINEPRYHLTFSRDETNAEYIPGLLKQGVNVSVVFNGDLPRTYWGFKVVDGDKTDIEMIYNKGVILGLRAKGDAKKDTTGFVVHIKETKKPERFTYYNFLENEAKQKAGRSLDQLSPNEYTALKNERFLNQLR